MVVAMLKATIIKSHCGSKSYSNDSSSSSKNLDRDRSRSNHYHGTLPAHTSKSRVRVLVSW